MTKPEYISTGIVQKEELKSLRTKIPELTFTACSPQIIVEVKVGIW